MSDEQFTAYQKRLEDEICEYMDAIEGKENKEFDFIISHHAFTNAMAGAQIVERRRKEGNSKLQHFNFVHGTAVKMYIKETDRDEEYPERFLPLARKHVVFTGKEQTAGVWVNSVDYIGKFSECFPAYPKDRIAFSRIGVNQRIFCPKGTTSKDLAKYLDREDMPKLKYVSKVVTFVGKFADWKRLDAVLEAATTYERDFPNLGTVIVGSGPEEEIKKYKEMRANLGLQRTFFVGAQEQPVLAELYSMAEVGVFPSYKEPFGMVFIECMACGTPVIGANSGGPTDFITSTYGALIDEQENWQEPSGMKELGLRLAQTVKAALNDDWKGKDKGPKCVAYVKENYSTLAQCESMLYDMKTTWAPNGDSASFIQ